MFFQMNSILFLYMCYLWLNTRSIGLKQIKNCEHFKGTFSILSSKAYVRMFVLISSRFLPYMGNLGSETRPTGKYMEKYLLNTLKPTFIFKPNFLIFFFRMFDFMICILLSNTGYVKSKLRHQGKPQKNLVNYLKATFSTQTF